MKVKKESKIIELQYSYNNNKNNNSRIGMRIFLNCYNQFEIDHDNPTNDVTTTTTTIKSLKIENKTENIYIRDFPLIRPLGHLNRKKL